MLSLPVTGCLGGTTPETSDGTEVELGEPLDDWPTYHVPSASNLPTCPGANDENLGKLYYVEDVTEFQACASGGWETVDFSTPQPSAACRGQYRGRRRFSSIRRV